MTRAERAKENFLNGYNCTQAVMLAYADLLDIPEDTLLALALPMGGGMGRLRQTCGAVSGAVLCSGILFKGVSKAESYAIVREITALFAQKNGSFNCGELLTGAGIKADNAPMPEERTKEYYKKRPCPELIYDAAEILERVCLAHGVPVS